MPAAARLSPPQYSTYRTAEPERRRVGADRRSTWRGGRRDVDWITHLEQESADRRERLARNLPSLSGLENESHRPTR